VQTNVLAEWLSRNGGARAKRELAARVGRHWQAIHRIAEHGAIPRIDTARAIERETGGEVRAAVLVGLEAPSPAPKKRGRPRTRRYESSSKGTAGESS
jgi:ribosome-binding protein aMBF1 (putative translation factor)